MLVTLASVAVAVTSGTAPPTATPTVYAKVVGLKPDTIAPLTFKLVKEASVPSATGSFQK